MKFSASNLTLKIKPCRKNNTKVKSFKVFHYEKWLKWLIKWAVTHQPLALGLPCSIMALGAVTSTDLSKSETHDLTNVKMKCFESWNNFDFGNFQLIYCFCRSLHKPFLVWSDVWRAKTDPRFDSYWHKLKEEKPQKNSIHQNNPMLTADRLVSGTFSCGCSTCILEEALISQFRLQKSNGLRVTNSPTLGKRPSTSYTQVTNLNFHMMRVEARLLCQVEGEFLGSDLSGWFGLNRSLGRKEISWNFLKLSEICKSDANLLRFQKKLNSPSC